MLKLRLIHNHTSTGCLSPKGLAAFICSAALFSASWSAVAQDEAEAGGTEAEEIRTDSPSDGEEDGRENAGRLDEMRRALEDLKKKSEAQEAVNKRQSEEIAALRRASDERLSGLEDNLLDGEIDSSSDTLNVYGFFQLRFVKLFLDDDSMLQSYLPAHSSFNTDFNLYFSSRLTDSLRFLAELAFYFSPHGEIESFEVDGVPGTEFKRIDTSVAEPIHTNNERTAYYYGSFSIERVHLTYSPNDTFNILLGRYLTPYGIWNIDHGAPVVLSIYVPYMQLSRVVPLSQTGVQIFGRLFPSEQVYFDYAVTLSNGRGPTESVIDLNENKGLGLRLQLTLNLKDLHVSLGTYGYYDKVTVDKKVIGLKGLSPGGDDKDSDLWVESKDVEVYREYILASNFKVEYLGLLLQVEYVISYTDYEVPGLLEPTQLAVKGQNPMEVLYTPNYIAQGGYAMLGYTLPLEELLGAVKVTPYVRYETFSTNDTVPMGDMSLILGGVNVRPTAYLVLKAEYTYIDVVESLTGSDVHAIYFQTAVSF